MYQLKSNTLSSKILLLSIVFGSLMMIIFPTVVFGVAQETIPIQDPSNAIKEVTTPGPSNSLIDKLKYFEAPISYIDWPFYRASSLNLLLKFTGQVSLDILIIFYYLYNLWIEIQGRKAGFTGLTVTEVGRMLIATAFYLTIFSLIVQFIEYSVIEGVSYIRSKINI